MPRISRTADSPAGTLIPPTARLLLLPLPFLEEGLLPFGYIRAISIRVYEDARPLRRVAAKLALQPVVVAMGAQKDVAMQRFQNLERFAT